MLLALAAAGSWTIPGLDRLSPHSHLRFVRTLFSFMNGNNTLTTVAQDSLGRVDANTVTCYFPTKNVLSYDANGNLLTPYLYAKHASTCWWRRPMNECRGF